jgi:molecular chaperone GrpE
MSRHRPDEGAVRQQLRERDEPGDRETTTDGAGAAAKDAAAPAQPAAPAPAPEGESEQPGEQPEGEGPREEAPPPDPLAEAEAKRDEYLALAQRTQADFENYRRRTAQQAAQAGERAKVGLLRELLPVVDNLERAEAAAADSEGPLHEGVKLVLADLQGVLAREGVEEMTPVGEKFDPTVHEAISTAPAQDGTESGVVVEVVEKGYRSRDTVIRPARVVVSA